MQLIELGLIGLVVVLAAILVAVLVRRRGRARTAAAAAGEPRTVADLVRQRELQGASVTAAARPTESLVGHDDDLVNGGVVPDSDQDDFGDDFEDDFEDDTDAEPADPAPAVLEPPAVAPAAVQPDPYTAEPPISHELSPGAGDTPWNRAARMAGQDVPLLPAPAGPAAPAARARRTEAETAAEQAATDLALVRTFGINGSTPRPPAAAPTSTRCSGRMQPVRFRAVDRDGTAVAGASVTLLDDRGRQTSTAVAAGDGRGELCAPAPGSYMIVSAAADHQPGVVAIVVADAPVEADVLLARSASLSGSVFGEDGPIAGARLTLVQDGEVVDAVESATGGAFRIADLAAGGYTLSAAAEGCAPRAVEFQVPDGADLRHDVDLDPAGLPADDRPVSFADDLMAG